MPPWWMMHPARLSSSGGASIRYRRPPRYRLVIVRFARMVYCLAWMDIGYRTHVSTYWDYLDVSR